MARLATKTKPTLLPTNLCIKWGLYHVRRYYSGDHKLKTIDKQVMIEGTGVNRIDMERLRGGFEALNPKHSIGSTWQKQVELEITISNVWTIDEVYSRE